MINNTSTRPTAGGLDLDHSAACFGELRRSDHLLHDVDALRARLREEGYLWALC